MLVVYSFFSAIPLDVIYFLIVVVVLDVVEWCCCARRHHHAILVDIVTGLDGAYRRTAENDEGQDRLKKNNKKSKCLPNARRRRKKSGNPIRRTSGSGKLHKASKRSFLVPSLEIRAFRFKGTNFSSFVSAAFRLYFPVLYPLHLFVSRWKRTEIVRVVGERERERTLAEIERDPGSVTRLLTSRPL